MVPCWVQDKAPESWLMCSVVCSLPSTFHSCFFILFVSLLHNLRDKRCVFSCTWGRSLCLSYKGGIIINIGSKEYNENSWIGKKGKNGKIQIVAQYPLPGLQEAFLAKLVAFLHFASRCHHKTHATPLPEKCLGSFSFSKVDSIVIRISHCCT